MSVARLIETFEPSKYQILLNLSNSKERIFTGKVIIEGDIKNDNSFNLHSKALDIDFIKVNNVNCDYKEISEDEISIFSNRDNKFDTVSESTVEIGFKGKINDSMHGLYPCYYNDGEERKELLATQFESHHAREVFPCVDEPEAKAIFKLTILTNDNGEKVISNTKAEKETIIDGNIRKVEFEETPKMSTYLLALVVGDLHKKTKLTKSGVEVSAWATKVQSKDLLDFPLDIAVKVLDFYEEYFKEKFPLSKCDHVALPDFSSGAMENWGLITYRETAMLAGEKHSIADKRYVATVIAHETAHQWFGNLVTMKWWDDLWLNESFATMMEYYAVDNIHPEWNVWQDFAVNESIISLRRDAIDGVQAVRIPVHHPDEINTIFDGAIVYAKGARLMNMLREYIGDESFRNGLIEYFKKFKYQNTIGNDLWNELSIASGKDVKSFMNPWLEQPGYPVVKADKKGNILSIEQKQFFTSEHNDMNRKWPIYIASNVKELPEVFNNSYLEVETGEQLVRLNQKNVSHFIANYKGSLRSELLKNISSQDVVSRLQFLQEQSLLAKAGEISSSEHIATLNEYRNEESLNVWEMMSLLLNELKIFVDKDTLEEVKIRLFVAKLSSNLFKKLGVAEKENDSDEDVQLRPLILANMVFARNEKALNDIRAIYNNAKNIEDINAEIRSVVLSSKVRNDEDDELISNLLEIYKTTNSVDLKDDIRGALTSTTKEETIKMLLTVVMDENIVRAQDIASWFIHLLRNRYAQKTTWKWLKDNWAWLENKFDGDKSYDDFPRYAGAILNSEELLKEYSQFFAPMKQMPSLARAIEMGERDIEARVKLIKRDKQAVLEELNKIV